MHVSHFTLKLYGLIAALNVTPRGRKFFSGINGKATTLGYEYFVDLASVPKPPEINLDQANGTVYLGRVEVSGGDIKIWYKLY